MRFRFSLGIFVALATANGAAMYMYGCGADANAPADDPDASSQPQPDSSISTGDDTSDSGGGTTDSGPKSDSGPKDAGLDAKLKPDVGPPGSPCNPIGANQNNPNGCGWCGTQSRVCLDGDAGAGVDAGVWSDWGACLGDHTGDPAFCDPTVPDAGVEACGMCGHRQTICQIDCHKNNTLVCQGEPPNACNPGDTKFTLAQGCTNPNQGRSQTCGNDCVWGAPSGCIDPPPNPNTMNISKNSGTTVSKTFNLNTNNTYKKPNISSCPTTLSSTVSTFVYVQLNNTDTVAHTVEVWGSSSGTTIDTIMTAYQLVPQSDSDRLACVGKVKDTCATPSTTLSPACTGQWAGMVGTDALSIPAGGSIQVYTASYYGASSGSTVAGDFQLNARTE